MRTSFARALAIAALAIIPAAAVAAPDPNTAPYAYGTWHRHEIDGTVVAFWPYNANLFGGRHVDLHDGTIINPTGITLQRGMRVRIFGGWNQDGTFRADEIDVVPRRWYERDDE